MSLRSLYHISQAYALVNQKLSSPESIADHAIASVVSLVIYQQIHSQDSVGITHLNGLCRMIKLRGGIDRLMQENRALALKPLRYAEAPLCLAHSLTLTIARLDLELTLRTGLPSMFHDSALFSNILSTDCEDYTGQSRIPAASTADAMLETSRFAKLLNYIGEDGRPKLDGLEYTERLLSLLYRLLDGCQYTAWLDHEGNHYDSLVYLALLAFMTTLLPEYGRDSTSYPLLTDRLNSAINHIDVTTEDTQGPGLSLLLWALFMSGLSSLPENRPLSLLIPGTCRQLGLYDWPAVRDELCRYPWVSTLHDFPGQSLWEQGQAQKCVVGYGEERRACDGGEKP